MRWKLLVERNVCSRDDEWHRTYAWRPLKCIDGTWVWLETVEKCKFMSTAVPQGSPFTLFGMWSFRVLPLPATNLEGHEA